MVAWLMMLSVTAAPVEARVVPTPGGPQIRIAGQLVPPRMFWGSPRGGSLAVGPETREISFEFTAGMDVPQQGTLHFRFGQVEGDLWLRDLRLVELDTGRDVLPPGSVATPQAFAQTWHQWPTDASNTVGQARIEEGALHVTLTAPKSGSWPDWHLYSTPNLSLAAGRKYRFTAGLTSTAPRRLNVTLYHLASGSYAAVGGPPGVFLSQVALAADAGVDLVSFSAPACWGPAGEEPNWAPLDQVMRQVLSANPDAWLLPRIGMDAPPWWLEAHPDARMVYEGGKPGTKATVSSRAYRADAATHLEQLCRHLSETFPDRFVGVHPCGQNTGEWFYEQSWPRPLSGYDPSTLAAWREWLGRQGEPGAASAEVPSAEERHAAPNGLLRDPLKERRLVLFNRFLQDEMADMVLALAAAARRGTAGQKLVTFFYGYAFEFAALGNGMPIAGHYALRKLLDSPDIDILCSPISYTDRAWGETGPVMSPAESVMMAGKLWLSEDDTRTFLDPRQQARTQEGGVVTLEQTQQLMLRNTTQEALRGFGSWWMDLPGEGWFNDSRIWDVQERIQPLEEAMLARSKPFAPDIAMVIDERGADYYSGGANVLTRPMIYEARASFGRAGAPFGQYLLDDAVAGKVPARLQVYLAVNAPTAEQRRALAAPHPGVTRVWCHAPGSLTPAGVDLEAMAALTGFRARPIKLATAAVEPTAAGRAAGLSDAWGPPVEISPLYTVEAGAAETWATYADGSPAVAVRGGPNGTDVFLGTPAFTPALVRALARLAGVHLYTADDAMVWAAGDWLALTPTKDGPIRLEVGACEVRDALAGTALGRGPTVSLAARSGETRLLRLLPQPSGP